MSSDWFDVVSLIGGRWFLQGSREDQSMVVRELTPAEIERVEQLQARQHAAMQRLLRELAA